MSTIKGPIIRPMLTVYIYIYIHTNPNAIPVLTGP